MIGFGDQGDVMSRLASASFCFAVACVTVGAFAVGRPDREATVRSNLPPGTTGNCSDVAAPAAANAVGYTQLRFCDDFDSMSTIDVHATGAPGYKWYVTTPYWGNTPPRDFYVSNSSLSITDENRYNYGLSTTDPHTANGHSWTFGYFEARISFEPRHGLGAFGRPGVWTNSAYFERHLGYRGAHEEIDIYEALGPLFYGHLHEWRDGLQVGFVNSNPIQDVHVDWRQWQTVAILWEPDSVTWYLNGTPLMTQHYSSTSMPSPPATNQQGTKFVPVPTGTFSKLNSDPQKFVLGSGRDWPMHVDWVRIWQKQAPRTAGGPTHNSARRDTKPEKRPRCSTSTGLSSRVSMQ